MSLDVITFGCRLNAVDSETIRAHARGRDDLVVVNACAVTAEATRQARQAVRRAARANPGAEIVVTGCGAEIEPHAFSSMPEVARVVGAADKLRPETWGAGHERAAPVADAAILPPPAEAAILAPRAFVQVQTGCDHRCTFCVIPFGRGASRSTPKAQVIAEVRRVLDRGAQEAVLTGVDLTSWGLDLGAGERLGDLVRAVLAAVPELPRLRLSSLDAVEIDDALVRAFAEEERLAPHLHLSLQSGDDMILKRMKRRHSRADAVRFCDGMRRARPDVAFGCDVIAGFPTETDAMFENTRSALEDCGIAYAHVFPYSVRPGVPAARMPQVAGEIIKTRAAALRATGEALLARHLAGHVGRRLVVLSEGRGLARAADFALVRLAADTPKGAFVDVDVAGHDGRALLAAERGMDGALRSGTGQSS
ncbi:threonylcarbamoyladenosine tRNA methylthiotransferase MtaB [Methylopila capsulata]|uniref:Threonylcarbamoyladenosine tRNA methylthiotransferase MtaB n=1 Tax=Methylopila capsulata TaxID=61654 RepID=A0A9W6MR92_9HYPH|nr:tRNA (N(6)-L-threonylcarbamoyladenosine(37)-C(2))-methylthiotransferase MtaB [Methylopila capsulata]MBM7851701.1 threonylcarbamoyladenosine tRNA methylthiotransferase MtaB [Methylopila capsulata]GLK54761.1 tRNA (N(6)-L-threonylcarbamoyladenosine(37)-C(2))-methylthiotransferase MtaB [Methylopila capsulata]